MWTRSSWKDSLSPFCSDKARAGLIAVGIVLVIGIPLAACGPFFPPSMLEDGTKGLLAAPVASFERELQRIAPKTKARAEWISEEAPSEVFKATSKADKADLAEALANLSKPEREKVIASYATIRDELCRFAVARKNNEKTTGEFNTAVVSTGVPPEFTLYMHGAIAFQHGRIDAARMEWARVLELPAQQRHFKTTWAAFMLGKASMKDRPEQSITYFKKVRVFSAAGFADSLGLATASLGWQAKVEFDRKNFNDAIELYLAQMKQGDPTAPWSLRDVARKVSNEASGPTLMEMAQHENARRILTSYFVAQGGKFSSGVNEKQIGAWLAANEAVNAKNVDDADRLAWMAYQSGKFDASARWLNRADPASSISLWIRSKLLLRKGKMKEACDVLAEACRAFPKDETWNDVDAGDNSDSLRPASRTLGELGMVV